MDWEEAVTTAAGSAPHCCPGIDQPHGMRTWENGANGAVHYYALDLPSGSVRGLFNINGTLTHIYEYSPFGEPQRQSEGTHNPLRFAARELDAQTGMYYVRARWYDPFLGRFLSEDPIWLAGGINQYAYALNDPVNLIDPSGLQPCRPGKCRETPYLLREVTVVARRNWYLSLADQVISLGGEGRGTSIFGAGMVVGGGWNDDGQGPGGTPGEPDLDEAGQRTIVLVFVADDDDKARFEVCPDNINHFETEGMFRARWVMAAVQPWPSAGRGRPSS